MQTSRPSFNRPVNFVLEPILKEPGDIAFTWLEIYRTKNSLMQHLDGPTNSTVATTTGINPSGSGSGSVTTGGATGSGGVSSGVNDTLGEFGFYPRESDCE